MRSTKRIFAVFIFSFVVTMPTHAAVFEAGEEYSIPRDIVISENFYGAGGSVVISGNLTKDAFTAGGKVLFNGTVGGDAVVAGGTVDLLGAVGDDARVAGGQLTIGSVVTSDLVALGGTIHVLSDSSIGEDAIIAGGRVVFEGTAHKSLRIFADEIVFNGVVGGDITMHAGSKISFGERAQIRGNLNYKASEEVAIDDGVVLGVVTFDEGVMRGAKRDILVAFAAFAGLIFFVKLFGLLFTGIFAVSLFPKLSGGVVGSSLGRFGRYFLVGLVVSIVIPVVSFVLLTSFIGAFAAFILMGFYVTLFLVASVYSGIIFGGLIAKWTQGEVLVNWRWATIGIVLLQFISLVPVAGWAIKFAFLFVAFGALLNMFYEGIWLTRRAKVAEVGDVQDIVDNNSE